MLKSTLLSSKIFNFIKKITVKLYNENNWDKVYNLSVIYQDREKWFAQEKYIFYTSIEEKSVN